MPRMIKAISLDFWNTVAKPNPEYTQQRTKYLAIVFGLTEERTKQVYTETKRFFDGRAEDGYAADPVECCTYLIGALAHARGRALTKDVSPQQMADVLQALFIAFPPIVDPALKRTIEGLRNHGIRVGIASNTNFIYGMSCLAASGLDVDFYIASDDPAVAASKPSPVFFDKVIEAAGFDPSEILHIGDMLTCDINGARRAGMKATLIVNVDDTLDVLNNILEEAKHAVYAS